MAITEDPAELIAEAMEVYLRDDARAFDGDLLFDPGAQISIPEDPSEALKLENLTSLTVLIIPVGGTAEKHTRGRTAVVAHSINVVIASQLNATSTRKRLNGFNFAVRQSLRGEKMAGYFWEGENLITKYDPDRLRASNLYLSAFTVSYSGVE